MSKKNFWEELYDYFFCHKQSDQEEPQLDLEDTKGEKRTLLALERTIHAKRRTFLANERTFLAWIRTSIAIMGFGFLIEKFSMFLWMEAKKIQFVSFRSLEISNLLGVIFIGLGALVGFLAIVRFIRVERDIEASTFRPSIVMDVFVGIIFLILVAIIIYYITNWHSVLLIMRKKF